MINQPDLKHPLRALRMRLPGVRLLAAGAVLLVLAAVGCASGAYPVDIFPEMHYQESYASNEPPRLSPPAEAVPWFGPIEPLGDGEQLFVTNCAMCHGLEGQGDGNVLRIMETRYGYETALDPNLASISVQTLDDASVKSIINQGVTAMPSFSKLLSPHEIDLILAHIRTFEAEDDGLPRPLFIDKGCGACHTIEGMDNAVGTIGPDLTNIASTAATRVPGLGAEEYIRASIEDPNAFIVAECPTGPCALPSLMPPTIRDAMTDEEFEELVEFLMGLQ